MTYRSKLAFIAVLLSLAAPRIGAADNGVTTNEFSYTDTIYNDCLGENWIVDLTVIQRTHVISLPGGQAHVIDNWFLEGTAVSQISGLHYYTQGGSAYVFNAGGARTAEVLTVALTWNPIDGGPRLLERWRFHLAVDANGIARVVRDEPLHYRCIGN